MSKDDVQNFFKAFEEIKMIDQKNVHKEIVDKNAASRIKKVDPTGAQRDIDKLKAKDKIKRKPRKLGWPDFLEHQGQIVDWAKAKGGSKYKIAYLLSARIGKKASPDRIRRFVIDVLGEWPHARKTKKELPHV